MKKIDTVNKSEKKEKKNIDTDKEFKKLKR
jgi:hypothetical protein